MKKRFIYTTITLVTLLYGLLSCSNGRRENIDGKQFTVRAAKDGNTLIMDNMLTVKLLGIQNTPSSFNYLKQELVGKTIRLKADKTLPAVYSTYMDASRDSVFAHVALVTSGSTSIPLNGYMLKSGFAKYAAFPNNDSATVYRALAELIPNVKLTDEQLCLKMTPATFLIEDKAGAIGTGFFISDDGLALTNNHVINDEENAQNRYTVYLSDEYGNISRDKNRPVLRVLYTNADYDFTIFRVRLDPNEKSPCLFVARNAPTRGTHVGVVGNPRGLTATFSTGEFSAFREMDGEPHTIQITAPVNHGNSGGPICDEYGIVIGIVKSILADGAGNADTGNLNFGVDIRVPRLVLNNLDDVKTYYGK